MDNIVLNGPNGSSINVGSFLLYDPGADFGEADLLKAAYAENPAAEGGVLAFETVNMRRMAFPLRLASTSAFSGVNGLQAWLRTLAKPGATLDVQLEGVASAEAVRFDVAAGRLEADYEPRQYGQADRLPATLKLDVQPFGYWPTMILLASTAPASVPFSLTWDPANFIGDVPGQGEVIFAASHAGTWFSSGVQAPDAIWWSLGRASGASLMFGPSGMVAATADNQWTVGSNPIRAATAINETNAPLGRALRIAFSPTLNRWLNIAAATFTTGDLASQYRGNFRLYGYFKTNPSFAIPWQISVDEAAYGYFPLASAHPVATLVPQGNASWTDSASSAYQILDLGVTAWPPASSIGGEAFKLRIWMYPGTSNVGIATPLLDIGGIYAQPVDDQAGVIARRIIMPTTFNVIASTANDGSTELNLLSAKFILDAVRKRTLQVDSTGGNPLGTWSSVIRDFSADHRGVNAPLIGATTSSLDIGVGGRKYSAAGATAVLAHTSPFQVAASVRYRPRFAFMKGI